MEKDFQNQFQEFHIIFINFNGSDLPKKTFKSLASPISDKQSPLFGVNSISNISPLISCS